LIRFIYIFIYNFVSRLTYLVSTDLRLTVEYKNTNEETSQLWSDRHVAIGNSVLKTNTVSDEENVRCEGQCLNSAFEKLREGMLNVDPLFVCSLHFINQATISFFKYANFISWSFTVCIQYQAFTFTHWDILISA